MFGFYKMETTGLEHYKGKAIQRGSAERKITEKERQPIGGESKYLFCSIVEFKFKYA